MGDNLNFVRLFIKTSILFAVPAFAKTLLYLSRVECSRAASQDAVFNAKLVM